MRLHFSFSDPQGDGGRSNAVAPAGAARRGGAAGEAIQHVPHPPRQAMSDGRSSFRLDARRTGTWSGEAQAIR